MSQPTLSHEDLVQRLEAVEAENRTLRRRLFETASQGVVEVPDNATPIFERAHAAIDQLFQGFEADPARGRIDVSGQRYLLVRGAALSVEFFRMVRSMFGNAREEADSFAARMLYDLAHANGGHDATELHELLGLTAVLEKMSAGPIHFSYCGWSTVKILEESRPIASDECRIVYEHPVSFEADSWIERGEEAAQPVCVMNAGYSAGWCEQSFGIELESVELTCRAQGHDTCRFLLAPPHRLEGHLEDLREQHPDWFSEGPLRGHGDFFSRQANNVPITERETDFAHRNAEKHLLGYAHSLEATRGLLRAKIEELESEVAQRAAMQTKLERTQRVVDDIPTAVVWIKPDGHFLYANHAATNLLGYSSEELLRRSVLDVDARANKDHLSRQWARLQRDSSHRIRTWYRHRDGREFPVEIHANYHDQEDGAFVFCFIEDISRILAREDKWHSARETAEREARSRGDLLATMSHELRTPLAAVVGMTDLLSTTDLDEEQIEFVSVASDAANHLHETIDGILEFSRLDSGALQLEDLEVTIHDLIGTVVSMIEAKSAAKDVAIVSDIAASVPHRFRGDPGRLRQVLLNLLSNAEKFTERGEIRLRVRCLDPGTNPLVLLFEVTDTGPGIAQDRVARLFDPYSQEDASVRRRFGGTGLGLAISKRIVEGMGGQIGVRSTEGQGSTFWFDVRVQPAS